MTKQEVYEYLQKAGIWHEITEHKAVYNMNELSDICLPYPEAEAKNIFVRDDKKRNYYLIVVKGNKRINLKEFRQKNGTRPLSFASEKDLMDILNLMPGAVTPFGILNDDERKVTVFIDKEFMEPPCMIGVHPNENTATVILKTNDLIHILKQHGNEVILM